MKLLPSVDCVLQCNRTPEEIRRIIGSVTVQQKKLFFRSSEDEFTGTVYDAGFEIVPRLGYRNSFTPVIRGRIETDGIVSRIWIHMQLNSFSAGFSMIWFGFLFFFLLCIVFSAFTNGIVSVLSVLLRMIAVIVMILFGWLLMRFGFQRPADYSLKRIRELVEGIEVRKEIDLSSGSFTGK